MKIRWLWLAVIILMGCGGCSRQDEEELTPPQNLTLTPLSEQVIQLDWPEQYDSSATLLVDRRCGDAAWNDQYASVPATQQYFRDTIPASDSLVIAYRVRLRENDRLSDFSPTVAYFPINSQPLITFIRQIETNTIRLAWTDRSVGEDGFIIARRVWQQKWYPTYAKTAADVVEFQDNSIPARDSVFYQVSAYCGISTSTLSPRGALRTGSLTLENLYFGDARTLEIMTWNIQNFPRNGSQTCSALQRVVRALEIDVIALQEIESPSDFQAVLDSLPTWRGYRANSAAYNIDLAYIYNPSTIAVERIYEIYTDNSRAFPRSPLVLEGYYRNIPFVIINNHYKCCGDGKLETDSWDEEHRRWEASGLLAEYIQTNFPDERVVVVGDMNDELTDPQANNVFQPFLDAPHNFIFADISIARGSSANFSYPTIPSHIDHILITNELSGAFNQSAGQIKTILLERFLSGGWNEYAILLSDHRPVAIKLAL